MEKIKLNAKETRNLTKIKIDDVKQLIKDAQFVLDEFYYDKQIAYMPWAYSSSIVNPIEDVYKLIETIEFMIDKFNKNEWERESELDHTENVDLANILSGLRMALHNSAGNAIYDSQFKDKYMNWWNAYFVKNKEIMEFRRAEEKLENKIEEEAGWVPKYSNGKIYYSYYTDYNGQRVSLDNIERDDEKEILNAKIVQERINRGY